MKKEKTLTDFLFGINGLHIILCLVVMFLRKFKIFSFQGLRNASIVRYIMCK